MEELGSVRERLMADVDKLSAETATEGGPSLDRKEHGSGDGGRVECTQGRACPWDSGVARRVTQSAPSFCHGTTTQARAM